MSETPQHRFYSSESNVLYTGQILSPLDEAHELATDASWLGAVGVASEIAASHATGTPTEAELSNPVTKKMLKKHVMLNTGEEGRMLSWQSSPEAVEADQDIRTTQAELEAFKARPDAIDSINDYIDRRIFGKRQHGWHWNDAMILEGADLPPIIRGSMDAVSAKYEVPEGSLSFAMWYNAAPREQRVNFAEWYDTRLKVLTDPQSRKEFTDGLKQDYAQHVQGAMAEGWIDPRYNDVLQKRMRKTDVRFFSPFGNVAREFGGAKQGNKSIIAMPTLTGPEIVTHELGHVFAGVDLRGLTKHFEATMGEQAMIDKIDSIATLFTVLNEGFNEHMTAALLNGAPDIISPAERAAQGVAEVDGASHSYEAYREIFGMLVGGEQGRFSTADMRALSGMMIEGDTEKFVGFLNQKWGSKDVLSRMLTVTDEFMSGRRQNPAIGMDKLPAGLLQSLQAMKRKGTALAA